jgi:molybdate transport system substrate-binding protein
MTTGSSVALFSGLAMQEALDVDILPEFTKANAVSVDTTYDPTTVLVKKIGEGSRPDVVFGVTSALKELAADGHVDAESITQIIRSGVGVAVAKDSTRPDISTKDQFVDTLLKARSVAYSSSGASGIYFSALLEKLGIAEQINEKATILDKGYTATTLLDGRADIAIQQLSELAYVKGVDIVGPLPSAVQKYTEFSAAIGAHAPNRASAELLLGFLASPESASAFTRIGLELFPEK